jgi:hypothetical protein
MTMAGRVAPWPFGEDLWMQLSLLIQAGHDNEKKRRLQGAACQNHEKFQDKGSSPMDDKGIKSRRARRSCVAGV